ncbi:class I SAM-dependent methyltransferase [Mycobacterium vicinigordonae]|uniref:Class I SAM-dependent methyltransferase n=2 Tax=Mycobacterium vicinigordonae TaxID=1719132 RepID=A0A7D6E2T3_9MYCO|nr:class I SAM-dependent methyltransferase [Mycobacterium vicinigordonae]
MNAFLRRVAPNAYIQDGLISVHSHTFMQDPKFIAAYNRGVEAIGGVDTYRWHWRVHVGLWVAAVALQHDGDFVECGVNRGFLSSAIMEYFDWNSMDRDFYLLDTFTGLDERFISDRERESGALQKSEDNLQSGFYVTGSDSVRANFAQWPRARIIEGVVPDTLSEISTPQIAYLHLDMNCAAPEIAALEHLWERLSPGSPVLLDDYAYLGYEEQKHAMDGFALARGLAVCSMPTGQGLLIKPVPKPATNTKS